jgi:2-polyprenyl-6-methoxyphenol hydroxylase-like FAD-dependent oxidoreductase
MCCKAARDTHKKNFPETSMKVAIAGAGIGGLTLALMLHERGIDVEVFEAVTEIKPLGVGINLLPHASQQLCLLGLEECLAEEGIETSALAYFNKFGQEIWREPRGRAAGYPWPQFSIQRQTADDPAREGHRAHWTG